MSGGFLAGADLEPNAIERARLARAGRYVDLTSSNPTQQGLIFPPAVLQSAATGFWETRRYTPDPRGSRAAREAIAADYARARNGAQFDPDAIFLTASTSEAYSLLFALLTEPGDNVLAPDVGYPLFDQLAALHHIELRPYRLLAQPNEIDRRNRLSPDKAGGEAIPPHQSRLVEQEGDTAQGWAIDEASLLRAVDARTRAVLLVSPHNPTGHIVTHALPKLDQLGLPLICDEVFAEFPYRARHTPLIAALHPGLPVFTLNGISKRFALPDLKLGWVAMNPTANAAFAARFELLNDLFLGANALSQHLLPALFEHGGAFVQHMRTHIRTNLDMAIEMLRASPRVHVSAPDGGYYLFPHIAGEHDEDAFVLRLLDAGVLVHPGYFYGCEADDDGMRVMISCLVEQEKLREGIDVLMRVLRK
jgi:alanine-synthesizing transaminase